MQANDLAPVLVAGRWRAAAASASFGAHEPATAEALPERYPVSSWSDVDEALEAAAAAAAPLAALGPDRIAAFLRRHAELLEDRGDELCEIAARETGLPFAPRLRQVELARTCNQLRQAAGAAETQSWRLPTHDREAGIHSVLESIGPVAIFGPNNFPLAFHAASGGDFAAAIAAGNPVIAKAHPLHPQTSRKLAECAHEAAQATELPAASFQMLYAMADEDGLRLVSDPRLGASAFTGSRAAGLALKRAADAAGRPIYLELSSVNPVVLLGGALRDRFDALVDELAASALLGGGQFCTNPGIVFVEGDDAPRFAQALVQRYDAAPCATLLGKGVQDGLARAVGKLLAAGAELLAGGTNARREGCAYANTLMQVSARHFCEAAEELQGEAFGNATLLVIADDVAQIAQALALLEGNLTGSVYSARDDSEDAAYAVIAAALRPRVGRLLNDKMPTGVAVSPAMHHGGPFPASGHPHFTAVGIPASMRRFTRLACYDNVRPHRLPEILRKGAQP